MFELIEEKIQLFNFFGGWDRVGWGVGQWGWKV